MMTASNLGESKSCPICGNDLPLSFFGTSRARRDGKNLYCKKCINIKVKLVRRDARERKKRLKEARNRFASRVDVPLDHEPSPEARRERPADRILQALRGAGWQTYRELLRNSHLNQDTFGDGLTQLLLWDHSIETIVSADKRFYRALKERSNDRATK